MTREKNNAVTQREHPAFEDDYIAPHRRPSDVSDRLAFAFVKALRFVADRFFAGRYGHRAVVLETVAARLEGLAEPDVRSYMCDGSPLRRTHDDYGSDRDPNFATSVDSKRRKTAKNDE